MRPTSGTNHRFDNTLLLNIAATALVDVADHRNLRCGPFGFRYRRTIKVNACCHRSLFVKPLVMMSAAMSFVSQ